jgi:hypothetical protein
VPLNPRTKAELDRRGPAIVRSLLQPDTTGVGPGAEVRLFDSDVPNPLRQDVEAWLREQELDAEALATERHKEQMAVGRAGVRWAMYAFWAGVASAILTLVSIVLTQR